MYDIGRMCTKVNKEEISKELNRTYTLFPYNNQRNARFDVYERGEGVYIYDHAGRQYMDLSSQFINVNVGFGNEDIVDAAMNQMKKLHYIKPVDATDIRGKLCEKIIKEIAPPNMAKIFLTLGGSDANDSAVRIAKAVTGKRKILSQYVSYHGASIGAANLCGDHERIHEKLESRDFIHFIGCNSKDLEKYFSDEEKYCDFLLNLLEDTILYEHPDTIAAIFFETITLGNIVVPPKRYYEGVRRLCDKYNILLVFDEVLVGFGRTGKWFACEHYSQWPDIITFAKGVTSSYMPLGGVMVSRQIADKFEDICFNVAFTGSYHPVSCAAAYAAITYMQENNVIQNAEEVGRYLKELLQEKILPHDYVDEIRGIGLLQSIVFKGKINTRSAAINLANELRERGYVVYIDRSAILIAPPLIITKEQMCDAVNGIDSLLTELENERYIDLLEHYPDESVGYEDFYSRQFIADFADELSKYNKVLLLASANANVMGLMIANLKKLNKVYNIYISQMLYQQMEQKENCIIFNEMRFDWKKQNEQIQALKENGKFDCVLMPYVGKDNTWDNVFDVAKMFDCPVLRVTLQGEIIQMQY